MKMTRWISSLAGLLAMTVAACSSTSSSEIDNSNAGGPESDAAVDDEKCGPSTCEPLPDAAGIFPDAGIEPCADPMPRTFEIIARANELGEGLSFVTLRDRLVVAEDTAGTPYVFAFPETLQGGLPPMTPVPFDPPPPEGMRVRAIVGSIEKGLAILCDDGRCVVHRTEKEGEDVVFRPLTVSLPNDGRGIEGAFLLGDYDFCVFGDGLHCVREGEAETLADGAPGKLLAVSRNGEWLVGEKGRAIYLRGQTEPTTKSTSTCAREVTTGLDVDLYAVDEVTDELALAVGANGHVVALTPCGATASQNADIDYSDIVIGLSGLDAYVTHTGQRVKRSDHGFCIEGLPSEIPSKYFVVRCNASTNVWILQADALWGETRCVGGPP